MPLTTGARLGTYEIVSALGAGGMGEVYRARDTKLGRAVAIKVLPEAVATDPERIARFEREAKVLASLNHPHIAALFGMDEADGRHFLVMELVEGETLAERIASLNRGAGSGARGPREESESSSAAARARGDGAPRAMSEGPGLLIEDALPIAKQIAEALEAAHERGIIHRDLKPANIKVRPDGVVKVLDFGLAKALAPEAGGVSSNLSQSPTLSVAATREGIILGTAAYMSPEQAKGRAVDKRTDVWAFGCVLYEMLAGRRAFEGEEVSETLAFVITKEPDWPALPAETPAAIRRLVRRCLEKDPTRRLRDIGDASLEVGDALAAPRDDTPVEPPAARRTAAWVPWVGGLVLGASIAGIALWTAPRPATSAPSVVQRFSLVFPASAAASPQGELALSRDGTRLVYRGADGQLYVRALDDPVPRLVRGTEDAYHPFFSPDGEWIGFFGVTGGQGLFGRAGQLKKVSVQGGTPITLADAVVLGGSWGSDETIIYSAAAEKGIGLYRIAASGGTPQRLTVPPAGDGEVRHAWPEHLPAGDAVIFSITNQPSFEQGRIAVLSLRTGEQHTIVEQGYHARYLATGHLVYILDGNLMTVPFATGRLQATGSPFRILEGLRAEPSSGLASFGVSTGGLLVYAPASDLRGRERTLERVTRDGRGTTVVDDRGLYSFPRLSPDGRRLAVGIGLDVWILDLESGRRTRMTSGDRGFDPPPPITAWTPDSRRLTLNRRNAPPEVTLDWASPDGSEPLASILTRRYLMVPGSWSKDGKALAFFQFPGGTERDLWVFEQGDDPQPKPFLVTRFNERAPSFSPDQRWMAYVSDSSGRDEVYLRPYPGPGGERPVSTGGGREPVWSRDGRELFYREGNRMMVVPVDIGTASSLGQPRALFEDPSWSASSAAIGVANYDVSLDGRHFITISEPRSPAGPLVLTVVQNWLEELKRLVPTK